MSTALSPRIFSIDLQFLFVFISPMQHDTWTVWIPISSKYHRFISRTREGYHHSVDYQNGWCRLSQQSATTECGSHTRQEMFTRLWQFHLGQSKTLDTNTNLRIQTIQPFFIFCSKYEYGNPWSMMPPTDVFFTPSQKHIQKMIYQRCYSKPIPLSAINRQTKCDKNCISFYRCEKETM